MRSVRGSFLCTLVLSIIGISGIGVSMALTRDTRWTHWHLSRLGEGGGFSALVFNSTLVMCAMCLLMVAWEIHKELVDGRQTERREIVPLLLGATALCWIGVGMFPFDRYALVHNIFGYTEFALLGVLMIGVKRWHEAVSWRTQRLGYIAVGISVGMMIGFHLTHFTSLLVVEIVGEIFLFGWLAFFTYDSSRLKAKTA